MMGPSQANKEAVAPRVSKRGREGRKKEDVEQQQQPIQKHPTGECARQATKEEVPVEKLNIFRDTVMSSVISQLDGELNPRPAYNNGVYFEHSRFCEDCLDKVTTAIMDGLRNERKDDDIQHKIETAPVPIVPIEEEKEGKIEDEDDEITNVSSCHSEEEKDVITPDNARLVARVFLNKLNFRVNDHVSLEFFNRKGMKKCLERDLFGGLPYEVARVVDRYGHNGKYAISEKLLGQHAYAATRSTGIVYDENDQEPITKFSDHSGLTIGEVLSSAIGDNRCSCMQSESFKDNEREDVEELANLAKGAEYNTTPYNGYNTVMFNKIEYSGSRVDEDDEDGSVFYSDSKENEDDSDYDSEEDDDENEDEDEDEDEDEEENEDEEEEKEQEPTADGVKHRIVNDDFRPSRSVKAESDRGDAPPLCLSICRHFDGNNCPFNDENKRKLFNAINFVKQDLEREEGDGGVVALIDGERHKIELCPTNIPSFAIGSSVYEVLVYDHDPLTAGSVSSSNKNAPDDVKFDHAMKVFMTKEAVSGWEDEEKGTRMSDVASVLCDQIFAKPCAKAYLTVTTAAVPWPCTLKTPPMSDVNSEGKYGSFRSFIVPLPCSYGGRRLNDSANGWRSRIYSNFVEDFAKRAVRPVPKGRLLDLYGRTWNFSTRNVTHQQLKVFGSVLRSECGDLDPSPLEYTASTTLCSRDAIEAQSDFSKLRRLLDTCNKELDTFIDGPYREAIASMRNTASEIGQEMEKNKKEEDAARKVLLETLNGQFEGQYKRILLMSEMATKQNNFRLQLERQVNNLSYLCASFVPGF
uniref:Wsv260-like protein n=1 Tax=Hemigrapsus takanoi nimavirus TaxID=2133792 RepID=A0A401IP15_9VIRU|nr:MAG: wsv260-like protein [Hemigrapsus takanoi nimavirus]GBG35342.1 wsv260-like protein [Hemigrapsus takanoi nimavirus]